mmetsp:Transcript_12122/g.21011  ORF Transcript_12122/g.21011 Transcript_12122/m.21011 type:complete len:395 (-) Transcript_12122:54-1238(-)
MRHDRTRGNNRLGRTQILTKRPRSFDRIHQLNRIALHIEPKHAPVQSIAMLTIGQFLLGMGVQTGVHHPTDLGMSLEEGGNFHGRGGLLPDAQSHRFHGLEHEEGGHGRHDVSVHVLDEFDSLVEFGGLGDERSPRTDVESVVVLGETLDGEVRPVIQGTANVGSGERGVAHVEDAPTLGDFGDGIEIRQGEGGVGRALAKNQGGVGLDRRLDGRGIGEVHEAEFHAEGDELLATDAIGAAVAAVGNDAVIARLHEGVDAGCRGGHAGGDANGIVPVFNFGHLFLEHFHGGVVGTAVAEPLLQVFVHRFLHEGGGHVHRGQDGAGFVIRDDSAVDDVGVHGTVGDPAVVLQTEGSRAYPLGGYGRASGVAAITAAGVEEPHPWRRRRAAVQRAG